MKSRTSAISRVRAQSIFLGVLAPNTAATQRNRRTSCASPDVVHHSPTAMIMRGTKQIRHQLNEKYVLRPMFDLVSPDGLHPMGFDDGSPHPDDDKKLLCSELPAIARD